MLVKCGRAYFKEKSVMVKDKQIIKDLNVFVKYKLRIMTLLGLVVFS